ncbi:cornifelin homolog B-like [Sparus aurata]|uniref:cornifelin homolog B-like n=1 Tax=Sparus aurata TaxID=8175 RepID=UPI0011C162A9|nr:cornifelin homolog B-like [Sparus aurata]XP_030289899.1 cornifelin homolog B-like [Sparus aurata]
MADNHPTDWKTGLFDCFEDASTCCYGFWCAPCLACTVSGRFGENTCLPLCDIMLAPCGIPMVVPPAVLSLRAAIRHKYNIKGSLCKDICVSCYCTSCSWCQMHRELKLRNQAPTTIINVQTTNYNVQPNPVMMAPAPFAYMSQPGVFMAVR